MNCPYCSKKINAMTGLQEVQKFATHLAKCKKNPEKNRKVNLLQALNIRAESGQ